jgi:hypothetical protein
MDRLSRRCDPGQLRVAAAAAALGCALIAAGAPAADDAPDYMPAIRQELARLDIEADCDDAQGTCFFVRKLGDEGRPFDVGLRYCRVTDTIYVYIDRFVALPSAEGPSLDLARRLLELNRRMVTAKLEWDRPTSSIRLSVVVNTDSNFDRRAFRSQLTGLWANAEQLLPELVSLAGALAGS